MGLRQIGKVFLLGVVLTIGGIVAVAAGIALWSFKHDVEIRGRLGIVIDAGGSSTKVSIFEERKNRHLSEIQGFVCEENGISSYTTNTTELEIKLDACLKKAELFLPAKVRSTTSLYFGATGGMRILQERNKASYDQVMQSVRRVLNASSLKVKQAEVLSGQSEGIYGWVSVNYLDNGFSSRSSQSQALEMGSTSAQISFVPQGGISGLEGEVRTIKVLGEEFTLYSHSYLCFGIEEFRRRYYASITTDANFNSIVDDPCHFKEDVVKHQSEYLWNVPCSTGKFAQTVLGRSFDGPSNRVFEFRGTSDPEKCLEAVRKLIPKGRCAYSHCGVNGVKQPVPHGFFTAYAALYYPVEFMGLKGNVTGTLYLDTTKMLCKKDLAEVRKIPNFSEEYSKGYCFNAAYSYLLLAHGLGFSNDDWNVHFKNKVNGQKISWRLGLQLLHEDSMSNPITEKQHRYNKALYNTLLAAGTMIFFMGILCLAVWLTIKIREKELLGSRFVKDDGRLSEAVSVEETNKV